jgi:hypothetical protein
MSKKYDIQLKINVKSYPARDGRLWFRCPVCGEWGPERVDVDGQDMELTNMKLRCSHLKSWDTDKAGNYRLNFTGFTQVL